MAKWFKNKYSVNTILNIKIKKALYRGKSRYQNIEVMESFDFGRMLVLDGIVNVAEKDEFIYHEMLAHVPLFVHPNPEKILVVGGGDGGVVREIAKHPQVQRIDLVEIDPLIVEVSKKYLPFASKNAFNEPRLNLFWEDGASFVKKRENLYDIIIIDATDPIGAGKKLFQKDFYNHCYHALNEEGILTSHLETPTFEKEFKIMKSTFHTLVNIFQTVKLFTATVPSYTPGLWCFVLCSKRYDPLKNFQEKRYKKLNLPTRYYNADIHRSALVLPNFMTKYFK